MYMSHSAISSSSTISSNDTASNIAGPGRNLGRFYDFAGKALERRLRSITRKLEKINTASYEPSQGLTENDALSLSSYSTNFTRSNLPGPGRNLGQLYEFLGSRLEMRASKVAEKRFNRGPDNYFKEISASRKKGKYKYSDEDEYSSLLGQKDLVKACQVLVVYASSSVPKNQYAALRHIVALSCEDEGLRRLFLNSGLVDYLESFDPNIIYYRDLSVRDAVISSSRKVLVCMRETQLFAIAKELDTFPLDIQRFEIGTLKSHS
ncbi:hypothetical protein SCHPADRAFT_621500 [Schizopora paradoxa]|uniref:Uncharacterized protein n=1 Tax=Schizopora paradoxa TaxID=27342 RepID=A0A0H2RF13_9AGAM|nr:hypothetical protein SCHPADRAFT_621500 [Schizopora paradoxa]